MSEQQQQVECFHRYLIPEIVQMGTNGSALAAGQIKTQRKGAEEGKNKRYPW